MTEHTPTPWKLGGFSMNILPVKGSGAICKFQSIHGMYASYEANAAFIVKAVNSHAEMDRLLAEAADELNNSPRMLSMDIGAKITAFRLQLQKGHGDSVSTPPGGE